jgi:hypothetical protein
MPVKTPLSQPTDKRKRLYLAEKSTIFPVENIRKSKKREEISTLLHEASILKPQFDAAEERLKEIRAKLFEYAADLDTNGFRTRRIAFSFNGLKTRRSLSPALLLEHGVSIETLNECYTVSDEYPDVKFMLFDESPDIATTLKANKK